MENYNPARKTLSAPRRRISVDVGNPDGWKPVSLLFLGLAILYSIIVVFGVIVFGLNSRMAIAKVQEARVFAEELNFKAGKDALIEAEKNLQDANIGLRMLVVVRPIPFLGQQVEGVQSIMAATLKGLEVVRNGFEIGDRVIGSSEELRALMQDKAEFSFYDLPDETRVKILTTISRSTDVLENMRVQTRLARRDLANLRNLAILPQITNLISPIQQILPDLESSINFFIPLAASISEIGGVDSPKQWLVLYLNNAELRPGGGFIGVYGLLETHKGEIKNFSVQDVYEADALVDGRTDYFVRPPQPLVDYLGIWNWYFRDANWSPDFATSADFSRQLLRQQKAYAGQPVPPIDGVIAITPEVAERVLAYIGPITVNGIVFTADNVYDLLQFETQFGYAERGVSPDERKELISLLTDAVVARLISLPISELPGLLNVVLDSFQDKHIGVRSYNEDVQRVLQNAGWAQVVSAPTRSDVLMVVDANLASLKSDPFVDREISYTVNQRNGRSVARVEVNYIHRGSFSGLVTRYRTFVRVYAPFGSELIKVEGNLENDVLNNPQRRPGRVVVESDLGMTSFGTFTSVEPGRIQKLVFEYYLPETVNELVAQNRYNLKVFKQMGTASFPLTLNIDFGKNISNANPAEARSDRGNSVYTIQTLLDRDLNFTVLY
jgi:hypothetical protein